MADTRDQMQADTDAGMIAYIFAHPDEFLSDLVSLQALR